CSILPFCILPTHYESDTRLDAKRNPLELLRLSAAQSASLCPAWAQSSTHPENPKTGPCIQHAVKKLLVAGGRGAGKDAAHDIDEAIDAHRRWQDMRSEER